MIKNKKLLIISAHAADYVWRSGGTIAKYIEGGAAVKVIVLSYGVRGESNDLWKAEGATYDSVKAIRHAETSIAAKILGIKDVEFWDLNDYPMVVDSSCEERLVKTMRTFNPDIIISHDKNDVLNPDHNTVHDFVWRCSIMSNSAGVRIDGTVNTKQQRIFGFEPHQTELSGYVPDELIDITSVYDKKVAAMNCFEAQKHLIEYYSQRAFMRGNHLRRISGNQTYKYAESFSNYYPVAGDELV